MLPTFEQHRTVTADHIDVLGHVGNLVFLDWLLEAAQAHSDAVGLSWERYRELGGVFVVRRHEFDYLGSAYASDPLVIRTWIEDTTRVTSIRAYTVCRGEETLVCGRTRWAFVSLDTGRPCRIPAPVLAAFEIAPQG